MAGSSSTADGSVVSRSASISTERRLSRLRTRTLRRQSSTPARRDSCGPQVSMRSATCEPTVPRPIRPTLTGPRVMGAILPAVALILREADVQQLIEMDDVIARVDASMRELGEGVAQNEPRRRAYPPGGMLNVMFASYPGGGCTGLKGSTITGGKAR